MAAADLTGQAALLLRNGLRPRQKPSRGGQRVGSHAHLFFGCAGTSQPPAVRHVPGHLATLLVCAEKEMAELFGQFAGYPLSTRLVTRGPVLAFEGDCPPGEDLDDEVPETT